MNETMSFDEALDFLKTTRTTLYRWLHEGAIPATKLGRQWRFSTAELTAFRDGGNQRAKLSNALREFGAFLKTRDPRAKEKRVMEQAALETPDSIAAAIIWDAYAQKASDIHMQTRSDGVHLLYRLNRRLEKVRVLDRAAADAIQKAWIASSTSTEETGAHRLFPSRIFEKKGVQESANLQVLYQSINTLQGPRVTLRILHHGYVLDLAHICNRKDERTVFERWLAEPKGLILFAGKTGSGKTTTLLSCLNHLTRDKGKAVFSIEDPIEILLDGVDQLQVDTNDNAAVDKAFLQIHRSDLDAIAIGIQSATASKGALAMARSGHLVLQQIHAVSAEDAVKRFEAWVDEPIRDVLLGVCYQELVPDERGGRKAVYHFLNG
jgi:type IV pilus assembly protein PilB